MIPENEDEPYVAAYSVNYGDVNNDKMKMIIMITMMTIITMSKIMKTNFFVFSSLPKDC
jgi:hypothetical protein